MSNEIDLLKPRYKVIADYPKSIHRVGDIYTCGGKTEDLLYADHNGPRMRDYPHLFELLPWYAERDVNDLPEYVKSLINQEFYKVVEKNEISFRAVQEWPGGWGIDYPWSNVIPALESEYNNCLQSKSK